MRTLKFDWEVEYSWGFGKSVTNRIIKRKTEFCFIDKFEEIKMKNNSYMIIINDSISSKEKLLNEFYTKLKFPSYYGFNWDALSDCLAYLENIQQENVIIYHNVLPHLNDDDMKIYLNLLKDSSGERIGIDWCTNDHIINIYFDLKDYDKVQQLIG